MTKQVVNADCWFLRNSSVNQREWRQLHLGSTTGPVSILKRPGTSLRKTMSGRLCAFAEFANIVQTNPNVMPTTKHLFYNGCVLELLFRHV